MSDSLTKLSILLAQTVLPIIIVLCVVGNVLNILVLTRPALRLHACSYYFLALAINNLVYAAVLVYYLLVNGFQLDLKLVSSWWCRITQYIATGCPFISPYFIVFASIDRFCASSKNAKLRSFSNVKFARRAILSTVVLSVLFFINTLVLDDLMVQYGKLFCIIRTDIAYNAMYVLTQITLFSAVPPCLMIVFGLLTIYNINQSATVAVTNMAQRRTEGQLIRMLLLQVVTYIILNMPLCILYLMLVLPTGYRPSTEFSYAFMIAPFFFHLSYAMTFFLYTLSARVYRNELVRLLSKILPIRINNHVLPTTQVTAVSRQVTRNPTVQA